MGMTIAEKILAATSGRNTVVAGDVVTVYLDTIVLFDNNLVPGNWRDIQRVCDVGGEQGISHQLVADYGYAVPGSTLACSDTHTWAAAAAIAGTICDPRDFLN